MASQLPLPLWPQAQQLELPLISRLEKEVLAKHRGAMQADLQARIEAVAAEIAARKTGCRCTECGKPMENKGNKKSHVQTLLGSIGLWRPAFRCTGCQQTRYPLDEALGLEAGFYSPALVRLLALIATLCTFVQGSEIAERLLGIAISPKGLWKVTQRLGQAAWKAMNDTAQRMADVRTAPDQPAPQNAPDAVVLGTDGCMLGMQRRSTRRHRTDPSAPLPPLPPLPKEAGEGFRENKTGVILLPAERTEPSPGRRSVVRRYLVSCLGTADEVFNLLWAKLQLLGWLGPNTVVVIVGDGAKWIWNRAALFSNRCEILDFWHAAEHAWDTARVLYGSESKKTVEWATAVVDLLRAGRVDQVIALLGRMKTKRQSRSQQLLCDKAIADLLEYYTDNQSRMRYDEYLAKGYGIGSGAIESAHKQVTHARMRQAGMRWSEAGARRMLALRVLLLNGEWNALDSLVVAAA
jgi:hypothetical protein